MMKLYSIIFAGFVLAGMYYGAAGTIISFQNKDTSTAWSDCRLMHQEVSYASRKGWISRDAALFYLKNSLTVRMLDFDDPDYEKLKVRAPKCQEIYEEHVIQSVLDTEIL